MLASLFFLGQIFSSSKQFWLCLNTERERKKQTSEESTIYTSFNTEALPFQMRVLALSKSPLLSFFTESQFEGENAWNWRPKVTLIWKWLHKQSICNKCEELLSSLEKSSVYHHFVFYCWSFPRRKLRPTYIIFEAGSLRISLGLYDTLFFNTFSLLRFVHFIWSETIELHLTCTKCTCCFESKFKLWVDLVLRSCILNGFSVSLLKTILEDTNLN